MGDELQELLKERAGVFSRVVKFPPHIQLV